MPRSSCTMSREHRRGGASDRPPDTKALRSNKNALGCKILRAARGALWVRGGSKDGLVCRTPRALPPRTRQCFPQATLMFPTGYIDVAHRLQSVACGTPRSLFSPLTLSLAASSSLLLSLATLPTKTTVVEIPFSRMPTTVCQTVRRLPMGKLTKGQSYSQRRIDRRRGQNRLLVKAKAAWTASWSASAATIREFLAASIVRACVPPPKGARAGSGRRRRFHHLGRDRASSRSALSIMSTAFVLPCRRARPPSALVADRLVWAAMIVKGHPRSDAVSRFASVGIGFQMHFLVFERAPQPFDENVVHAAPASVHRNRDACRLEPAGEGRRW